LALCDLAHRVERPNFQQRVGPTFTNLSYFVVEFAVAVAIGSVSLFADSIDFLEDTSLTHYRLGPTSLSALVLLS
jgi:Co/Zn/Cd efflux system component